MKPLRTALLLLTWTILAGGPADAGEGTVLAIRPEGIVIDASPLSGLQPGARVGFLRNDGQRTPVGQGFVLDAQGGQALVGIAPGAGVRMNDLVVLCPTRAAGGDPVRPLVEGIRAQGSSPQVQQTAGRLLATLDAREAAIQQGNCDVARFDVEIEGLLAQLQNEAAGAQTASAAPTGSWATGPPGPAPAGGYAPGGYVPSGSTSPQMGGGTGFPVASENPPSGYVAGGAPAGSAAPPGDAIDTASRGVDLLAKLAVIAQTLGVSGGGAPPASGGYPATGGAYVPPDTGSHSASAGGGYGAPSGGAYGSPASGGTASGGSYPTTGGGYGAPSGGAYGSPASGGTASGGGYPTTGGGYGAPSGGAYGSPASGGTAPPAGGSSPPGGGRYVTPGGGFVMPGGSGAASSSGGTGPATGTASGTGAGTSGGVRAPWQVNQLPAGAIRPYVAAIPKATVAGRVQTQTGQPLAAAQITIGDAKGQSDVKDQSDAQGQFTIPGLAPGQYTVTVTAAGYQRQVRAITLDAGETERLLVVMPRGTVTAPFRVVPKTQ